MEDHAQSGWLCELVVGSDDAQMREGEFVELLVGTGATEHACGPHDFKHAALTNGPRPALKTATGEPTNSECLKVDGQRHRDVQAGKQSLRRFDGATVDLTRRGGLFVLQCQAVVSMLLALVYEQPAGQQPTTIPPKMITDVTVAVFYFPNEFNPLPIFCFFLLTQKWFLNQLKP